MVGSIALILRSDYDRAAITIPIREKISPIGRTVAIRNTKCFSFKQGVVWVQKSLWVRVRVSNGTVVCQGYTETHIFHRNVPVTRYILGIRMAISWFRRNIICSTWFEEMTAFSFHYL